MYTQCTVKLALIFTISDHHKTLLTLTVNNQTTSSGLVIQSVWPACYGYGDGIVNAASIPGWPLPQKPDGNENVYSVPHVQ